MFVMSLLGFLRLMFNWNRLKVILCFCFIFLGSVVWDIVVGCERIVLILFRFIEMSGNVSVLINCCVLDLLVKWKLIMVLLFLVCFKWVVVSFG